ncbi:TBC1 domain family member 25-like [Clytia hemisphaerica]|uniref:Rab-GAP TBC domain-containing protein n=1 Tax=Clytia hemisphaerica TaxID=252671 RepID=A0A7M5VB38_9CNID
MAFGSHVYNLLFDYNQKNLLEGDNRDQLSLSSSSSSPSASAVSKEIHMSFVSAATPFKPSGKNDHSFSDLEAVRIQATCISKAHSAGDRKIMTVDPNITSYASLYLLLKKAFSLEQDFDIVYQLPRNAKSDRPDVFLSLTSDWDLDAAFHTATRPFLQLKVQPFEKDVIDGWDIVQPIHTPQVKDIKSRQAHIPLAVTLKYDITKTIGKVFDVFATEKPSLFTNTEWMAFFDATGRMSSMKDLKNSIFLKNLEPDVRADAWPHLLGVFPVDLTFEERTRFLFMKTQVYKHLKENWMAKNPREIKGLTHMIQKDVLRTDRTHPFFNVKEDHPNLVSLFNILITFAFNNPDISYCQGMSDLVAPLLVVLNDEILAYLCFCKVMERLKNNFLLKGTALMEKFTQLSELLKKADKPLHDHIQTLDGGHFYFCYRMLLLELKREFPFEDAIHVMESIWSSTPHHTEDEDCEMSFYEELLQNHLNHGNTSIDESIKFSGLPPPKDLNDGSPFPLFLCLAIFILNREHLLQLDEYTMLAMHFDKLSRKLDATHVKEKAKSLFFKYLKDSIEENRASSLLKECLENTHGTSSTAAQC